MIMIMIMIIDDSNIDYNNSDDDNKIRVIMTIVKMRS